MDLRLVLTVSTQPVDKGQQAEVIPHLRDSGFILHPLDRDEPGLDVVSYCDLLQASGMTYMGSFP
jgi:hypothetical protein